MKPYDVTLTSCGRFDLLARTLDSLLPRLEGPVRQILIAKDSGDRGIYDAVAPFGRDITVLFNKPRLGQIKSIDRLYSHVTADWIFHCEDDWEFFRGGFIEESFALLAQLPSCSMVNLRPMTDFDDGDFGSQAVSAGVRYSPSCGAWAYAGMHFNPGLRRLSDYQVVGPYAAFGAKADETRVSKGYKTRGYWVAVLAEPAVRHIGEGRRVGDLTKRTWLRRRWRGVKYRLERLGGPVRY